MLLCRVCGNRTLCACAFTHHHAIVSACAGIAVYAARPLLGRTAPLQTNVRAGDAARQGHRNALPPQPRARKTDAQRVQAQRAQAISVCPATYGNIVPHAITYLGSPLCCIELLRGAGCGV